MSKNLLKEYSKELGLFSDLTLEELIGSHKHLRELNKNNLQNWREELVSGFEMGKAQGYTVITEQEYIKVSTLREMTIAELANFLG